MKERIILAPGLNGAGWIWAEPSVLCYITSFLNM